MTRAQIILHQYIKRNFVEGSVKITDVGDDKVKLTDKTGDNLTLTMNLYCDIMDADTKKIYAVSDLPHDLRHIGMKLPTGWTEVYENRVEEQKDSIIGKLSQHKEDISTRFSDGMNKEKNTPLHEER